MGASSSLPATRCESQSPERIAKDAQVPFEAPPEMRRPQSFEEKMWDKVSPSDGDDYGFVPERSSMTNN